MLSSSSSLWRCRHRWAVVLGQRGARAGGAIANARAGGALPPQPPPPGAEITSAVNPYIKHAVKLRESAKYRAQQRRLLLIGRPLLTELAAAQPGGLGALVLFVRPGAAPLPPAIAAARQISVNDAVMRKLTGLETADGVDVVAELEQPPALDLSPGGLAGQQGGRPPLRRLLVLEGVQDPGNMGTLLRCALAFGWDAAWLLPGCCDPFNDKAMRASRGAALRLPIAVGGWQELAVAAEARGMLMLAAEPEEEVGGGSVEQGGSSAAAGSSGGGSSSSSSRGSDAHGGGRQAGSSSSSAGSSGGGVDRGGAAEARPVCLVLGAEGQGLSSTALQRCIPVAIPMQGPMESLNVGVAGGILMFALGAGLGRLSARLAAVGAAAQPGREPVP